MAIDYDPHPQYQEYAHPEHVVSAAWLSAHLGAPGLKVVESNEDSLLYNIGHIPGAVRIDWQKDLNDQARRDFIDGEAFAALMTDKGIARDDTVVIYGDKANWWACYTLWVFELFGHPDVRLLDGGRDAWMGEERETSFSVPDYRAKPYPVVERNDADFRIFVDELRDLVDGPATILDARGELEYTGESLGIEGEGAAGVLRGGHIPGALSYPWGRSVYPNARFRPRQDIENAYSALDKTNHTIAYCQLGDRSAHTWFVLKYLLGFDNIRNYDGSWAEWGNMVRVPITQGDRP